MKYTTFAAFCESVVALIGRVHDTFVIKEVFFKEEGSAMVTVVIEEEDGRGIYMATEVERWQAWLEIGREVCADICSTNRWQLQRALDIMDWVERNDCSS